MSSPDAFELVGVDAGPVAGDPILRSIDLVVPANGVTVLAGPSGAGKSTLLRLLNRLDDPTAGEVRWRGRGLTDWDPTELRRKVAMVFQRAPIFAGTVYDNLRVALADVDDERATHALEHVGLPEAQLNLSHAAIYLAAAPKSNRNAAAIWTARSDVRDGAVGEVPAHLRDSHYQGAAAIGHGEDYDYPHDHASGIVAQQYLPDSIRERRWYEPSTHGDEAMIGDRLSARRKQHDEDTT